MTGRRVKREESTILVDQGSLVLPTNRIKCQLGCIKIGSKEYQSASEALSAYLDQFDDPSTTNLTTSYIPNNSLENSVFKIQQHKIINDEIQKAKQDLKIELLKKALDKSKKREQGYLQKEVDDALAKSGELLEKLNTGDDSMVQCPSDIGSLTTDMLLTINPYQNFKQSESKHVYSFHRAPRSESRTSDKSFNHNQNNHVDSSVDTSSSLTTKLPPTGLPTKPSKVNLESKKCVRPLRSRSVSPTSIKNYKTPSWVQELDASSTNGPPSWIDVLASSDVSDSIWTDKNLLTKESRPSDKLNTLTEENSSFYNSTLNGLNFSDLHLKSPNLKHQPFSELHEYTSKLMSETDKLLKESDFGSKMADSSASMEHQKPEESMATPKVKVFHTTLDRYIADMSSPFSGKKDGDSVDNMPRCSSMDNMMGEVTGPKSDITGASTIPMASNTVTPKKTTGRPTVTFSPNVRRSPDSSVVLEGDRPWENTPSLKAPVYVEDRRSPVLPDKMKISKSPTFSGGQQPGSMEALKKMLFKLQAENTSVESKLPSPSEDINTIDTLDMPALKDYKFDSEPGGHSLEKALVHLSRLKSLVEKKEPPVEESVLNKSAHSAPSSPRR